MSDIHLFLDKLSIQTWLCPVNTPHKLKATFRQNPFVFLFLCLVHGLNTQIFWNGRQDILIRSYSQRCWHSWYHPAMPSVFLKLAILEQCQNSLVLFINYSVYSVISFYMKSVWNHSVPKHFPRMMNSAPRLVLGKHVFLFLITAVIIIIFFIVL